MENQVGSDASLPTNLHQVLLDAVDGEPQLGEPGLEVDHAQLGQLGHARLLLPHPRETSGTLQHQDCGISWVSVKLKQLSHGHLPPAGLLLPTSSSRPGAPAGTRPVTTTVLPQLLETTEA